MRVRDLIAALGKLDQDSPVLFAECEHFKVAVTSAEAELESGSVVLGAIGWTDDCDCENCENCKTKAVGDCPTCFEETGDGCSHGELCESCGEDAGFQAERKRHLDNFLKWLTAKDLEFHLDDDPTDIEWFGKEPSSEDLSHLTQTHEEIWERNTGEQIWDAVGRLWEI